jgi:Fe-S-cluster-containing dehydrogenase component
MVFEDTCVGCKVCTIACPFGTINYNQDSGKVQKCDLCEGNPACASACPTGGDHLCGRRLDRHRQDARLGRQGQHPGFGRCLRRIRHGMESQSPAREPHRRDLY